MAGRRGSIQRRRPDPKRITERSQPEVDRPPRAKGGVPMFHDSGTLTIPPDGTVTAFHYRFPRRGLVHSASLRIMGLPKNESIIVGIVLNGDEISRIPWDHAKDILHLAEALAVDESMPLSVNLHRTGGEGNANADVDIAYLYQEVNSAPVSDTTR